MGELWVCFSQTLVLTKEGGYNTICEISVLVRLLPAFGRAAEYVVVKDSAASGEEICLIMNLA
jgi:hypothetical protein